MGTSKRGEKRGTFPLWQVNIDGKVYRGRHKTMVGAINTALYKFNAEQYTDVAVHVFQEAGPDPDAVWRIFCQIWSLVGKDMERKRRWEVDRLTLYQNVSLGSGLERWLPLYHRDRQ